ncbi:MAG TPA: hypothetical protein VHN14_05150 [Kofleriaceae bacterium]|jgi:hypothetical protein|nr:hypothetical protein [Kofleriaceae bacterium]
MEPKNTVFRRQLGAATERVRQQTLRDLLAPPGIASPASPASSTPNQK